MLPQLRKKKLPGFRGCHLEICSPSLGARSFLRFKLLKLALDLAQGCFFPTSLNSGSKEDILEVFEIMLAAVGPLERVEMVF